MERLSKVSKEVENRNNELEKSGDRTHHWRLVGQRGARTMIRAGGERQTIQMNDQGSRKRRIDQDRTGVTPPAQRLALSR